MMDVLSVVFVAVVALTLAAAVIYIGGFLLSMLASVFGGIADVATHHHHHQPLAS